MRICIPLRGPDEEIIYSDFEKFINDFKNFKNTDSIKLLLDEYEEKYQQFEQINFDVIYSSNFEKKEDEYIKSLSQKHSFFHIEYIEEFLIIDITFKSNSRENDDFSEITIEFLLSRLALILNLTYATKIDFLHGVIYSNENKYIGKTNIILSSLDFAYYEQIKIKWPKVIGLELKDTLNWYILNNLHTDVNSKNKLQRAINSFSYQFSSLHEKDTSVLFWTMLGIEALLAEGNSNIINQIKVKSTIILGEPMEYKKKLDKLYNYRSRFVHGDINFPPKFSSDYDNFEDEYYQYLSLATSILLALIRTLIKQNKSEFLFEYQLK